METPIGRRGSAARAAFEALRRYGFGSPSSVAEAANVAEFGRVTGWTGPIVMTGAWLFGSGTPPSIFSTITSLLNSHSGCSHPLAWSVRPREVNVHTTFCCLSQSLGTTTLNKNRCRLG